MRSGRRRKGETEKRRGKGRQKAMNGNREGKENEGQ